MLILARRGAAMALAVAAMLACGSTHAATPSWNDAPFSYYATDASVGRVLQDFARNFSLRLDMPEALKGRVNGRFNNANPTDFLNQLGSVYGFSWFTYAGVLYISSGSDVVTRVVDARGGSIGRVRQALEGLGVLDPRFGWGEMPERGIALVSGPHRYVALIDQIVSQLPSAAGAQEVRVFRLQHASVLDRTIRYRDREIVTPGLATMLRQLIAGDGNANGGASNETLAAVGAPLRSNPPVLLPPVGADGIAATLPPLPAMTALSTPLAQNPAMTSPAATNPVSQATANTAPAGAMRTIQPSIQADPRLNAVIVEDVPDRMPIYQKLIDQLDVPTALIQIEAEIIDVSRSRMVDLGIDWGARLGRSGIGFGNTSSMSGVSGSGVLDAVGSDRGATTIVANVGNSFSARVQLLERQGAAKVLASPSILTADNLGAVVDLSDTFYVQTRGQQVATVTPVSVGTTLNVTPRYVPGSPYGEIELTVDIEDGKILPTQYNGLPVVRKSTIGTQARISENEALVIAGYNDSDDESDVVGTPWLSKIPVLGALFRKRNTSERSTERLFVIRPTMIGLPPLVAGADNTAMTLSAAPAAVVVNGVVASAPAATSSMEASRVAAAARDAQSFPRITAPRIPKK